jgi:hypothetical protein
MLPPLLQAIRSDRTPTNATSSNSADGSDAHAGALRDCPIAGGVEGAAGQDGDGAGRDSTCRSPVGPDAADGELLTNPLDETFSWIPSHGANARFLLSTVGVRGTAGVKLLVDQLMEYDCERMPGAYTLHTHCALTVHSLHTVHSLYTHCAHSL